METGVPCMDDSDSVLSHQDGRVGIMHDVAGKVRQLRRHERGNFEVPIRFPQDLKAR